MRLPKGLTVGIFGASAVGKTVVANALALRFSVTVRHCGELARQAAKSRGCDIAVLPADIHDQIDNDTRAVAARDGASWQLIEGRYLDLVLSANPRVVLVRLIGSDAIRAGRKGADAAPIAVEDAGDAAFRERLSAALLARQPDLVIDTSGLSVRETEDAVIEGLRGSPDGL
jgi:cytidylate kinase